MGDDMKKPADFRSILLAVVIVLALGMTTAVFAVESETGQAEVTLTEQTKNEGITSRSLPDSEVLVNEFMLSQAGQELGEAPTKKNSRGSKLTGQSAKVYDILVEEIEKIANGEREDTHNDTRDRPDV